MSAHTAPVWQIGPTRALTLDRPVILGIVNVTPDSFSDGGRFLGRAHATDHARYLLDEGADALDIGGESTRPGAQPVPVEEQIARVVPVIERLRSAAVTAPISVDTTRADVARAALDAGADIINDVSAATDDPSMLALAAERRCGLILMHRAAPPARDRFSHAYDAEPDYPGGVVHSVRTALDERVRHAERAGAQRAALVIDPGLGFGKSVGQNYTLIAHTAALLEAGLPMLSALSRKSFIGAVTGQQHPPDRLEGTLALSVAHLLAGVRLFRVHDAAAHRRALDCAWAVRSAAEAPLSGSA